MFFINLLWPEYCIHTQTHSIIFSFSNANIVRSTFWGTLFEKLEHCKLEIIMYTLGL